MFNRIRLSLTAWYVTILLVIVALVMAVAYIAFSRSLSDEVDESLKSSARNVAAQIDEDSIQALGQSGEDEHDDDHGDDDDVRFFAPSGGDTFYLVLAADGALLVNPANVRLAGIPDAEGARAAAANGDDWSAVSAAGDEYRLYSVAVEHDDRTIAVVQVGRSLAEHERQLTGLLVVLGAAGGVGLILAAVGGLIVAGRALRPIRSSFDRQRAFVADASHELRTPLTIIRGNAEMLELNSHAYTSEEDRQSLKDITEQARYMESLIADLSLLARLDDAQVPLQRETVDAAELVRSVQRSALALGAEKQLRVEAYVPVGMTLIGDSVRLRELLMILVDNAVRYAPAGSRVTITAEDAPVPLITVADAGPGIEPAQLERIFDRFFRGDEARSRSSGGTGLGLSIAQAIAKAHGGTITAANGEGGGAVFTLELPRSVSGQPV